MLRKRISKTPNHVNRATYQAGRTHLKSHKRQNARGMIGATVQQDVQVTQTDGPCQHSCLRSDDRFQFCCCLSMYASKYRPEIPCQLLYLLLAAHCYVETYFRSCNLTRILLFSGNTITIYSTTSLHHTQQPQRWRMSFNRSKRR